MVLDDLADYLSSGGLGTVGVDLFKGRLPDTPDACAAVLEYGGLPSEIAMTTGPGKAAFELPRIQVLTRATGNDYSAARAKAHSAFKLLDGLSERPINGVRYLRIMALQPPFAMPRDQNDRVVIGCNYEVRKELSP